MKKLNITFIAIFCVLLVPLSLFIVFYLVKSYAQDIYEEQCNQYFFDISLQHKVDSVYYSQEGATVLMHDSTGYLRYKFKINKVKPDSIFKSHKSYKTNVKYGNVTLIVYNDDPCFY